MDSDSPVATKLAPLLSEPGFGEQCIQQAKPCNRQVIRQTLWQLDALELNMEPNQGTTPDSCPLEL